LHHDLVAIYVTLVQISFDIYHDQEICLIVQWQNGAPPPNVYITKVHIKILYQQLSHLGEKIAKFVCVELPKTPVYVQSSFFKVT